MGWGGRFVGLRRSVCCVGAVVKSSDSVRNLIGRRPESDWAADGIRLDGERNLIGRRTQSDWAAYAIRRLSLSCLGIFPQAFRENPFDVR